MNNYKVAFVHDWFTVNGGAEKVAKEMLSILGNADVFSLVDFLSDEERQRILEGKKSQTSFIQKLPFAKKYYRNYFPLFPIAIEQFDLSEYDLIISSSYAVSKGVITHSNQLHICYCHSPMRYAWDLYHQYLREANLTKGMKGWVAKYFLHKIRTWDIISSNRVDFFIANSKYIAKRIKKTYNRDSVVIYPPVNTNDFQLEEKKEEFYLTASRMVPYKKIDLIVEAFSQMSDKKLVVIGDGPDFNKIKSRASKNIEILGHQSFDVLKTHMQKARAFVFAAEEDFGIVPVEAQACGTPVIAYGRGGSLETVIPAKTGIFFYTQTPDAIINAVNDFEKKDIFDPKVIREHAERFNTDRFEKEIKGFIEMRSREFFS